MSVRAEIAASGWLLSADWPGRAWPGLLLYRDAFLVRAPQVVLVKATGLAVLMAANDSSGAIAQPRPADALPVRTVKVLEVDGWPNEPATAMLQLSVDSGVDVSVDVNRAGFELAVRVTGDIGAAFESLGLVPDDLDGSMRSADKRLVDLSVPTTTGPTKTPPTGALTIETVSVRPASWCDIFWWLC